MWAINYTALSVKFIIYNVAQKTNNIKFQYSENYKT